MNLIPSSVKQLFRSNVSLRRHKRFTCRVQGDLHFLDDGLTVKGFVSEVSQGGLKFKPNQTFIMRRQGAMVRVSCGALTMEAVLKNTTPGGYGVALLRDLDPTDIDEILASSSEPVKN